MRGGNPDVSVYFLCLCGGCMLLGLLAAKVSAGEIQGGVGKAITITFIGVIAIGLSMMLPPLICIIWPLAIIAIVRVGKT